MENFAFICVSADGENVKPVNISFKAADREPGYCVNSGGKKSISKLGENHADCIVNRNSFRQSNLLVVYRVYRIILQCSIQNGNPDFILGVHLIRKRYVLFLDVLFHSVAVCRHTECGNHIVKNVYNAVVRAADGFFVEKFKNRISCNITGKFLKCMTIRILRRRDKSRGKNGAGAVSYYQFIKPRFAVFRIGRAGIARNDLDHTCSVSNQ